MTQAMRDDAARCERLVAEHLAAAVQCFGAAALSVIDLPPLDQGRAGSPAQLRIAAVLLWARHVEDSGLLDFADALARGVVEGSLHLPIEGEAVAELVEYHRAREQRFDRGERRAIYERLFGGDGESEHPVPGALAALAAALRDAGGAAGEGERRRARIRAASVARELAQLLSEGAAGIAGFAAREIANHVRDALALVNEPAISHALGGLPALQALRMWAPQLIGRRVDPVSAIERARAGLRLLEWLAEAPFAQDLAPAPSDEVIAAAERYAGVLA